MFIRNDTSSDKKYYNGKLAQISYLDEDEISVILDGSEEEITLSGNLGTEKIFFG
jgi:hypothetical protein